MAVGLDWVYHWQPGSSISKTSLLCLEIQGLSSALDATFFPNLIEIQILILSPFQKGCPLLIINGDNSYKIIQTIKFHSASAVKPIFNYGSYKGCQLPVGV